MVQSDQLTTNIPNYLSNTIATAQQDDYDYQDNKEEELYRVDGTTDIQIPTDNSDDNEDNEPDNNACKTQRKIYAPADAVRKEMKKQGTSRCTKKATKRESKSSSQSKQR